MANTQRQDKAKADKEAVLALSRLMETYGGMFEAVKLTYPAGPYPLTISVLVTAGATPGLVPADEPFDEYGYYQMDWQLGAKSKYPWPGEQVKLDAFAALELEAKNAIVSKRR